MYTFYFQVVNTLGPKFRLLAIKGCSEPVSPKLGEEYFENTLKALITNGHTVVIQAAPAARNRVMTLSTPKLQLAPGCSVKGTSVGLLPRDISTFTTTDLFALKAPPLGTMLYNRISSSNIPVRQIFTYKDEPKKPLSWFAKLQNWWKR